MPSLWQRPAAQQARNARSHRRGLQAEMPLKAVAAPAPNVLCDFCQGSSSVWRAALLAVAHLQLCQGPLPGTADVLAHGGTQRGVHDGVNGIVDGMNDEGDCCRGRTTLRRPSAQADGNYQADGVRCEGLEAVYCLGRRMPEVLTPGVSLAAWSAEQCCGHACMEDTGFESCPLHKDVMVGLAGWHGLPAPKCLPWLRDRQVLVSAAGKAMLPGRSSCTPVARAALTGGATGVS